MLGTPQQKVKECSLEVIESSQLSELELTMPPSTPLKTVCSHYAKAWVTTGSAPAEAFHKPTIVIPKVSNISNIKSEEKDEEVSTESSSTAWQLPSEPAIPRHERLNHYLNMYENMVNDTPFELDRLKYLQWLKAVKEREKAEQEKARIEPLESTHTQTSNTPLSSPKLCPLKSKPHSPFSQSLPPSEDALEALHLPEDFIDAWL
ncbi:hypothetical protein CPB84DRAFT_1855066 [Gymnopilus junonius]|uniref:Uncharacterized protein n=1 Tax=Gymnopilus junonius TaxID=109634 RepID=A0A9P5TGB4_GYMJU|nr:hypothetical protein CPB84DRAFT_1855066 [Gymnopilus junonius]